LSEHVFALLRSPDLILAQAKGFTDERHARLAPRTALESHCDVRVDSTLEQTLWGCTIRAREEVIELASVP
jgi:hypothetical protein